MTKIVEALKVRPGGDTDEDFQRYFPDCIWAVSDFKLDQEEDGEPATVDEYLERMLLTLEKGKLVKHAYC